MSGVVYTRLPPDPNLPSFIQNFSPIQQILWQNVTSGSKVRQTPRFGSSDWVGSGVMYSVTVHQFSLLYSGTGFRGGSRGVLGTVMGGAPTPKVGVAPEQAWFRP